MGLAVGTCAHAHTQPCPALRTFMDSGSSDWLRAAAASLRYSCAGAGGARGVGAGHVLLDGKPG